MKEYKLFKIDHLSGRKCSIYSILDCIESETSLDLFIDENINSFKSETIELISRLKTIGHKTGEPAYNILKFMKEGLEMESVLYLVRRNYNCMKRACKLFSHKNMIKSEFHTIHLKSIILVV